MSKLTEAFREYAQNMQERADREADRLSGYGPTRRPDTRSVAHDKDAEFAKAVEMLSERVDILIDRALK